MIRYREHKMPAGDLTDGQLFRLESEPEDGDYGGAAGHHSGTAVIAYVYDDDQGEAATCHRVECQRDDPVFVMVATEVGKIRIQATLEIDLDAWAEEYGIPADTKPAEILADARTYFGRFTTDAMPEHLREIVRVVKS